MSYDLLTSLDKKKIHLQEQKGSFMYRKCFHIFMKDFIDMFHLHEAGRQSVRRGEYFLFLKKWREETCSDGQGKAGLWCAAVRMSRLHLLKRRLQRDEELHSKYNKTISDYLGKGYAKGVEETQ